MTIVASCNAEKLSKLGMIYHGNLKRLKGDRYLSSGMQYQPNIFTTLWEKIWYVAQWIARYRVWDGTEKREKGVNLSASGL